jgi:hypothetical protein
VDPQVGGPSSCKHPACTAKTSRLGAFGQVSGTVRNRSSPATRRDRRGRGPAGRDHPIRGPRECRTPPDRLAPLTWPNPFACPIDGKAGRKRARSRGWRARPGRKGGGISACRTRPAARGRPAVRADRPRLRRHAVRAPGDTLPHASDERLSARACRAALFDPHRCPKWRVPSPWQQSLSQLSANTPLARSVIAHTAQ